MSVGSPGSSSVPGVNDPCVGSGQNDGDGDGSGIARYESQRPGADEEPDIARAEGQLTDSRIRVVRPVRPNPAEHTPAGLFADLT